MGRASTDRRWVWGGLLGVALLGLLALLWPHEPEPLPAPGQETPARAPAPPPDASPRAPPPAAPPSPSAVPAAQPPPVVDSRPPGTTPEQPPEAPPIELPPTTQVLAEEFFPGTTEWEGVPLDESHQHQLRILPRRYNVVAPMPIVVLMELIDATGKRQTLPGRRVRLRALEDPSRPWIEVPAKDDGSGEDERAGDLLYTATLQPDREQKKLLLGRVLVEGVVEMPGVGTRTIPSVLIYTLGPRAKLTGRWNDSVRNGHLALEAELDVAEAGLFTLMAQVFGPHLEPIAWVKATEKLGTGRRTLTLEVFGKVLHDMGIDGPYRVRQVLLSRDQENSSEYDPGVTLEEAHQTKAYRASQFSPEAYVPPPRTLEEVTADHPSQKDKPPPERTRDTGTASTPPVPPAPPGPPPPQNAVDKGR